MALEITGNQMTATVNGNPIATATRKGRTWHATSWPAPLTYNEAITAMTLAEREATHSTTDPSRDRLARRATPKLIASLAPPQP
ncbi:hypothetical protein [Actinomadura sp. 21ATH]|uniref:hypothetical protein n=1 Tax=Actinomadura sp. 21ATH TaxID=1735444 RepID=UPI0035C258CB